MHSDSVVGDWAFSYDQLDRLSTAVAVGNQGAQYGGVSAGYAGLLGCWSYDAFGNRLKEGMAATACGANGYQSWATYNPANNQMATSSYSPTQVDAAGNTINDGRNEYWYDAEGRLCAAQDMTIGAITQYVYDASGARILKGAVSGSPAASNTSTCTPFNLTINTGGRTYSFATENQYLVGLGGEQVTEFDGWGDWLHSNVWLGGKLLASYDAFGPALHFDLTDPLGTKRVQANVAGQWDEACISLPFGNDVGNPDMVTCNYNQDPTSDTLNTWSDATEHHFTGKERDAESGNDYFLARYYSSTFGRFLSPDWSVQVEPVPYAQTGDPQTLNLYAYVRNNALTRVDLDGHAGPCDLTCQLNAAWNQIHQISDTVKTTLNQASAAVKKFEKNHPRTMLAASVLS